TISRVGGKRCLLTNDRTRPIGMNAATVRINTPSPRAPAANVAPAAVARVSQPHRVACELGMRRCSRQSGQRNCPPNLTAFQPIGATCRTDQVPTLQPPTVSFHCVTGITLLHGPASGQCRRAAVLVVVSFNPLISASR